MVRMRRSDRGSTSNADTRPSEFASPEFALPELILRIFAALHAAYFSYWLVVRHRRFATWDYDLGVFDQAIWLTAHGQSFMTVRGLDVWGHHIEPALVLFVPFYWLGAGPSVLNIVMVLSLTLSVIPIFRLTHQSVKRAMPEGKAADWAGLIMGSAFLAHFSGQWLLAETFHPEVMAIAPLLFGYLAATNQRWWVAAGWLIFAVSWKEDVALAVAMLGLILALRGERRAGPLIALAGAAWFLVATEVLLPAFSDGGPFYGSLYGDLGDSPGEVLKRGVTDPLLVGGRLVDNGAGSDAGSLMAPYGFVGLASPLGLLIGLPQFVASHLTITPFSLGVRNQYVAMPLVAATIATIEGLGQLARFHRRGLVFGLTAIAAGTVITTLTWGISHVGGEHDKGLWWQNTPAEIETFRQAVEMVPDDASVVATYSFVPQLTHRSQIYRFPNPWRNTLWAADPDGSADPSTIEWLVIYRPHLQGSELHELDEVLANDQLGDGLQDDGGQWEILLDESNVLVARRGLR